MGARDGCRRVQPAAYMIIGCIVNTTSFALCVDQFFMDWTCVNGDLVFNNFLLLDKLVNCFKIYIIGYDALHTKESEVFGFVCLLGFFFHWFAIAYHLVRNQRTWIRTRIFGMLVIMTVGVFLLCRGMVIPKSNAWHTNVVPAITIVIVLTDGVLVIRAQNGGNERWLRDLVLKLVEAVINIFRLVDLTQRTHNHQNAEKILRLVGSSMSMLIGIFMTGLMVYNAGIISKVIEWRIKNARVPDVCEDGNADEQAVEAGAGVELVLQT